MRIAIVGYGKMGKEIEALALKAGHEVSAIVRSSAEIELLREHQTDVAIEFTSPEAVVGNLNALSALKIATVCGTTGWDAEREAIIANFNENQSSLFYSSNFSIGVYLTFQLMKALSARIKHLTEYRPSLAEWHHTAKRDVPSGTALRMADILLDAFADYQKLATPNANPEMGEIGIETFREGQIVGTHEARFTSPMDEIVIRHEAFDRKVFAVGALRAAEFLFQRPADIYTMDALISANI